jgi:hypothetical protein
LGWGEWGAQAPGHHFGGGREFPFLSWGRVPGSSECRTSAWPANEQHGRLDGAGRDFFTPRRIRGTHVRESRARVEKVLLNTARSSLRATARSSSTKQVNQFPALQRCRALQRH